MAMFRHPPTPEEIAVENINDFLITGINESCWAIYFGVIVTVLIYWTGYAISKHPKKLFFVNSFITVLAAVALYKYEYYHITYPQFVPHIATTAYGYFVIPVTAVINWLALHYFFKQSDKIQKKLASKVFTITTLLFISHLGIVYLLLILRPSPCCWTPPWGGHVTPAPPGTYRLLGVPAGNCKGHCPARKKRPDPSALDIPPKDKIETEAK